MPRSEPWEIVLIALLPIPPPRKPCGTVAIAAHACVVVGPGRQLAYACLRAEPVRVADTQTGRALACRLWLPIARRGGGPAHHHGWFQHHLVRRRLFARQDVQQHLHAQRCQLHQELLEPEVALELTKEIL